MDDHAAEARKLFLAGANCAQAVLGAFHRECGIELETAFKLGSGFGGGVARLREVCGAVTGMFMAEGLIEGYDDPKAKEEKAEVYARVRALAEAFQAENHSIICRDLLIDVAISPSEAPEVRTKEYYERRPCGAYVENAARIFTRSLGLPEA